MIRIILYKKLLSKKFFKNQHVLSGRMDRHIGTFRVFPILKYISFHETNLVIFCILVSKIGISALSRVLQRDIGKYNSAPDLVLNHVHPGIK